MQCGKDAPTAQKAANFVFDVLGLTLFNHQQGAFAQCKLRDLFRHQWVGHVQDQNRNVGLPKRIAQSKLLQCANQGVVNAPLHNQTQVFSGAVHQLIKLLIDDVAAGRRNTFFGLEFFLPEGDGRMRELVVVKRCRLLNQLAGRQG